MRRLLLLGLALAATMAAQESKFEADMRHEVTDFKQDCAPDLKGIFGCAKDLVTDWPLHVALGSLAPQNGFAAGAAFVEHANTESWRFSWNADAVASGNASWRAGLYMKSVFTKAAPITVTSNPSAANVVVRDSPVISAYAQAISLNTIDFFGIGPSTSLSNEAIFGMRETIAGVNGVLPVIQKIRLSLFGELNGRFVDVRPGAILFPQTGAGFFQAGEGLRLNPALAGDHVELNYSATYQQFVAGGSSYSFQRFTADLDHRFPLYGHSQIAAHASNGPDDCSAQIGGHKCPMVRNKSGAVGLRLLISESFTSGGNVVPFYFQPTLGGSDLNGQQLLPSYHDYRFRAPNLLLLRASFEHSIYGPLGLEFLFDTGKVAATRGDIDFSHLAHSFGAGLTLRAGGIPQVTLLFAFGGGEGHHNILMMNDSLLGGSARPSLF